MTRVFGDYDQAALDWEYDNRRKVSNAAEYIQRYPELSHLARSQLPCQTDVAYGPGDDETLDIFTVNTAGGTAPIQVFFHGGYWRALHKDDFSYVARAFYDKNVITVVVNYALIPGVDMDELVRQCRAALAWVWHNAASFGGDRNRIYISGHSAGGHLVAMMTATDWPVFSTNLPTDLIKGACGISGLYDLEPIRLCFLNEELQLTTTMVERNSPVRLKRVSNTPLLLPLGDQEGPEYLRQSRELASAWQEPDPAPSVMLLENTNHFTIVAQLESSDSQLSRAIHEQMDLH